MRKPIIAGNHKMNLTPQESGQLLQELKQSVKGVADVQIIVFPPYTSLAAASDTLATSSIELGGQNLHWENKGAYTGEVSGPMLKEIGCQWVLCGHSERRHIFNESNEVIGQKLGAALTVALNPILCVGETLEQRESGSMESVLKEQVATALNGFTADELKDLVVAYEPVWAIGTGQTATPADANSGCSFLRQTLAQLLDEPFAAQVRILYGGSVKPHNVKELMAQEDIDGALVGGASLKADSFAAIVKYNEQ